MIIDFSPELEALPNLPVDDCENLFSELLSASIKGKHLVIISRGACLWAKSALDLSGRQKAHLDTLREGYTSIANIKEIATTSLTILLNDSPLIRGDDSKYSIGYHAFLNGMLCELAPALVLENLENDGRFYEIAFREAKKQLKIPNFNYELVHGGGSTSNTIFKNELSKLRVSVCIIDHDKLSPCGKQSLTSQHALKVFDEINDDQIGLAICTVGREIENFIPYFILREIHGCSQSSQADILEQLTSVSTETDITDDFWHYFDIKEGLCGHNLKDKLDKNTISQSTYDWIMDKVATHFDEGEEIQIEGFGKNVVSNFLKCGQSQSRYHDFARTPYWKKMYLTFFESILWYFCSPKSVRS